MTVNSFIQPNIVELPTLRQQQLHMLGGQVPHVVSLVGTNHLQEPGLIALICSAKAPASILLAVHDLAQQWRTDSQIILSGFHSTVEQEAFEILLRGPGQLVYCPARSLPRRLKPAWQTALAAGYLTLLSPFPESVRRATKETAITRNRFMAALADTILIAYAHPGSSTEQLAYEAKAWGRSVYVLPNSANHHLISRGISTWQSHC